MSKPTPAYPRWADGGQPGSLLEPQASVKDSGFVAGEAPGHGILNWLLWSVSEWIQYLDSEATVRRAKAGGVAASHFPTTNPIVDVCVKTGQVVGVYDNGVEYMHQKDLFSTMADVVIGGLPGSLRTIHSAPSGYVVAGDSGAIATSVNLVAWTTRSFQAAGFNCRGMATTPGSNLIAVGDGIERSTEYDGSTWSTISGAIVGLNDVTIDGIRMVAVGDSGAVYTSDDDGQTWQDHSIGGAGDLASVCWTGSYFVAVGGSGTTQEIWRSADGAVWESVNPPNEINYTHYAYTRVASARYTASGTGNLFATTERGEVDVSIDHGETWQHLARFHGRAFTAAEWSDGDLLLASDANSLSPSLPSPVMSAIKAL